MKKLTLLILGVVTLTQAAFAIEEWKENTPYEQGSKVTYKSEYYQAAWYAEPNFKPTDGKPWEGIKPPSPNPVINADYTYYIGKDSKSITEDMKSEIKDGTSPYTLIITKEPTEGKIKVSEASFTYTSNKSLDDIKDFTDTFELKVKDSEGNESLNTAKIIIKLDGWNSEKYYVDRIESDIRSISTQNDPNCWLQYFKDRIPSGEIVNLDALKYYVRVRGADECDLSKIKETVDKKNPDNVNRVIRLMPKEKFEKMFPMSVKMTEVNGFIPGKVYSYLNFLKAVAVMPGYCGDYKNDPSPYIQEQLRNDPHFAEKTAKKFLATTLAHAVQETTNEGDSRTGEWRTSNSGFLSKVHGTFGHVREQNAQDLKYPDTKGPFAEGGNLHYLTSGNKYYGRGAKQLSYPVNYSNTSLLLYGDLRLVKYPNLVEKDILPFLTAITYTLIPKSKNPSIAEIMDGSWSHKWSASEAPESDKKIYNRDFPLTVLIVNGGPECNGHIDIGDENAHTKEEINSIKSVANSKTRIDGYEYFSTGSDLLDPNVTYEIEEGPDYYKVDQLKANYINTGNPSKEQEYRRLFERHYYYLNGSVINYDEGIQIFGGKAVDDNLKVLSHPAKSSIPDKTHKSFL